MGQNQSSATSNIDTKDVACEENREDCVCGVGTLGDGSGGDSEGGVLEDEEMDGASVGGGDAVHDLACRPFCNVHRTPAETKPGGRSGGLVQFPTAGTSSQCDEQYCVAAQDAKGFEKAYGSRKMMQLIYDKEFPSCFYRDNRSEEATPVLSAPIGGEQGGFRSRKFRVPPQYVDSKSLKAMLSATRTGPYSLAAAEGQMLRCLCGVQSPVARGCLAQSWLVLGFLMVGWDRMSPAFEAYEAYHKVVQDDTACTQGNAGYAEAAHSMQMWRVSCEGEWLKFLRAVFFIRRSWDEVAMEEGCCFKHPSAGPCPSRAPKFRAPKYPTNKSLRESMRKEYAEWGKNHVGSLVPVHLEGARADAEGFQSPEVVVVEDETGGEVEVVRKKPKAKQSVYSMRRK